MGAISWLTEPIFYNIEMIGGKQATPASCQPPTVPTELIEILLKAYLLCYAQPFGQSPDF